MKLAPSHKLWLEPDRLFLRCLGLVYLIAFLDLGAQIVSLVGEDGLLPARWFLERVQSQLGAAAFLRLPTLFWFGVPDAALKGVCLAGVALSLLLIAGFLPAVACLFLYALYLSLLAAGQIFLGYQWDVLLTEAGFLAVFLAPWGLSLKSRRGRFDGWVNLLLRVLLFKVMFMSGVIKLLSKDPTWSSFTALEYHYMTQPLPNPLSWFAHNLPAWFHKAGTIGMFFIELVVPFGILGPRRVRRITAVLLIFLQLLIAATGNYGFFNLLTIVLCILLFQDESSLRPAEENDGAGSGEAKRQDGGGEARRRDTVPARVKRWILVPVVFFSLLLSSAHVLSLFTGDKVFRRIAWLRDAVSPFQVNNSYGLFAVMTIRRPEIIIEGSLDGKEWKPYELRFKPGALDRQSPQAAPRMPRVDWQMWFAALSQSINRSPWVVNLMRLVLEDAGQVRTLFRVVPFEDGPPRYVRARIYLYEFTTPAERKETGLWWKRRDPRPFSPVLSLEAFRAQSDDEDFK